MKKIIIVLVMLLLVFSLFGVELDFWALEIKREVPEMYEYVKEYSIKEWSGQADLIIQEINSQSYYLFAVLKTYKYYDIPEIREYINKVIYDLVNNNVLVDWSEVFFRLDKMFLENPSWN